MKKCPKCNQNKSSDNFYKKKKGLSVYCKLCQQEYNKEHYENNKDDYIERALKQKQEARSCVNQLKESTPCKDCGQSYPSYVMQFDHLPEKGKKSFTISSAINGISRETLLKEIDKCDIVCANCHAERTHQRLVN